MCKRIILSVNKTSPVELGSFDDIHLLLFIQVEQFPTNLVSSKYPYLQNNRFIPLFGIQIPKNI